LGNKKSSQTDEWQNSGGKPMKGESKEQIKSREEIWDEPFVAMCKGLDKFGPREILNILVENARQDDIILQLLVRFPTVVVLGEFLHTLPIVEVDKKTYKRLERKGWLI
jgi:hypothetical protein